MQNRAAERESKFMYKASRIRRVAKTLSFGTALVLYSMLQKGSIVDRWLTRQLRPLFINDGKARTGEIEFTALPGDASPSWRTV